MKPNLSTKEALTALRHAATDERAAVEFFEDRRWSESGPCCPRCGSVEVHQVKGKDGQREKAMRWKCKPCARQYSVRTGTVFEESRLPLRVWAHAYWRSCASKKGYAALQLQRETGIGYRAALFCLHRIRFGMTAMAQRPKLSGTVCVDETYCGGKPRTRNYQTRAPHDRNKLAVVLGAVQRGGAVRFRHVTAVNVSNVDRFLAQNVDIRARLMTDELNLYRGIGRTFKGGHETVNHGVREFARGDVSTNDIEGAFALIKRGLYGVYHSVSREHLHRYLAEFEFRYNARKVDDAERVRMAVKASEGKRLRYRDTSSEAA